MNKKLIYLTAHKIKKQLVKFGLNPKFWAPKSVSKMKNNQLQFVFSHIEVPEVQVCATLSLRKNTERLMLSFI